MNSLWLMYGEPSARTLFWMLAYASLLWNESRLRRMPADSSYEDVRDRVLRVADARREMSRLFP